MIDFSKVPIPGKDTQPAAELDFGLSPTDIMAARKALQVFANQVGAMEHEAKELTVNSRETATTATEMIGQVKNLFNAGDGHRKEIVKRPDSFVRQVNGFWKPLGGRLKALEAILKRKLSDFSYQEELDRRETERLQREAVANLQEKLNKQAEARGVDPVLVAPVAVPDRREPTRSDTAVASTVMVWDFEVQDPAAVPRPYLAVDEAAIRAAVRGGIRDIPGVRIFERAEIRVRRV
jgi:hypothetical protein